MSSKVFEVIAEGKHPTTMGHQRRLRTPPLLFFLARELLASPPKSPPLLALLAPYSVLLATVVLVPKRPPGVIGVVVAVVGVDGVDMKVDVAPNKFLVPVVLLGVVTKGDEGAGVPKREVPEGAKAEENPTLGVEESGKVLVVVLLLAGVFVLVAAAAVAAATLARIRACKRCSSSNSWASAFWKGSREGEILLLL